MSRSALFEFLEKIGAAPKKSLSQNFLIDHHVVQNIIRAAAIEKGEAVLEIGPGAGALTQALLDAGARVFAIEKDNALAAALHRLQTPDNRLHLFAADALAFPLEELPAKKVVANLPYHIATALLERFFAAHIRSMTLMVQKEMADRLLAQEGTKEISPLTLFARFHTEMKGRFDVPARSFHPRPKVDSAVISLESRPAPLPQAEPFFHLVRTAFQQRRKTMSRSLQSLFDPETIRQALLQIELRPDARPEMLSLEKWIALYKTLDR